MLAAKNSIDRGDIGELLAGRAKFWERARCQWYMVMAYTVMVIIGPFAAGPHHVSKQHV